MELLPHDVIQNILERVDVKTLLKFKSVSKLWRSTIQSPYFQQRQLIHRQSRGDPDLLLVSVHDPYVVLLGPEFEAMRTLSLGSPSISLRIPTPWEDKLYAVCNSSCDGLVYLYVFDELHSIVVNPTTQWYRTVPLCNYQLVEETERGKMFDLPYVSPGFGKDKINGTYKSVWLYNSSKMSLNHNITTCEVFDFVNNSWRYIVPASPYRILHLPDPVYFNGSLHWFTAFSSEGETMVLSLDLHTETFQIISKAPFLHASDEKINICNLDGRLCVSHEKGLDQVIWSFDSVYKTWNQIYSIDLNVTIALIGQNTLALLPLGVLGKDKLLLFYDRETGNPLSFLHGFDFNKLPKSRSLWLSKLVHQKLYNTKAFEFVVHETSDDASLAY